MIPKDASPVGHIRPYKRVDPMYPGRKAVITRAEVDDRLYREPDPSIYQYNAILDAWLLKGGV